jgi:predicted AlkP superfamily pyrophosphatase or phosphodiesterase
MDESKVCVINVVGMTPALLKWAPTISELGKPTCWRSPVPAVTCTSQATMLTGEAPSGHGIVGNGWYFRETGEIRFWQQSRNLIDSRNLVYDGLETANLFWWFNQHNRVRWSATPKPHYGCDGSKVFDILDHTDCQLQQRLGKFPFFTFWGPNAGLPSSRWIADAAAIVLKEKRPSLTLVYLPHLDYDFQRFEKPSPTRVTEVDQCAKTIIEAARSIDAQPIIVSEYGLTPVHKPVGINLALRDVGLLEVRDGPFGEMMMPGDSRAFAVVDHQIAHLYVRDPQDRDSVRKLVESIDGVAQVADPGDLQLNHPRSGDWIVLAQPDAWFHYYYWLQDSKAPDFARTVDIHRKPGYDPVELFMSSKLRAMFRIAQKKMGLRYKMDVIPLDPTLVRGSHGLLQMGDHGPLIIGPDAPSDMKEFPGYIRQLLGRAW